MTPEQFNDFVNDPENPEKWPVALRGKDTSREVAEQDETNETESLSQPIQGKDPSTEDPLTPVTFKVR